MSPLEQFLIIPILPFGLAGYNLSFTNSALFMLLAAFASAGLMIFGMRNGGLVPGRVQMFTENLHNAIADMVEQTAGEKSKPFFPFIFTLFLFVLFGNMLGMIPGAFTITSHLSLTFALALTVFLIVTITGFARHGLHFFSLFMPDGTPAALLPLLFVVDLFSYCVRPFSLSIRLFANMLAGHILVKSFAGMTISLIVAFGLAGGFAIGVLPLALNIFIIGFEIFVALLQAYVFAILSAVYLRDALEMH